MSDFQAASWRAEGAPSMSTSGSLVERQLLLGMSEKLSFRMFVPHRIDENSRRPIGLHRLLPRNPGWLTLFPVLRHSELDFSLVLKLYWKFNV